MTKPKPKPQTTAEAVRSAIARDSAKRKGGLKPIEIVKSAICAYQAFNLEPSTGTAENPPVESKDRAGLRRGTQSSVDRLLFNANYWLAAYEDRIVEACASEIDPEPLLAAVTVWGTHTLKLNTLNSDEVIATFERFYPPFAENRRKGSGKGPVAQFEEAVRSIVDSAKADASTAAGAKASADPAASAGAKADANPASSASATASAKTTAAAEALVELAKEMRAEADAYASLSAHSALDAFFDILPAWCLQDRIGLVSGAWWDDASVMGEISSALHKRFLELGYGDAPCQYFYDSVMEALDAYQRDIATTETPFSTMPICDLLTLIHEARKANQGFETEGYGGVLPAWLSAKEQLIWNVVACSMHGPSAARPMLSRSPGTLVRPEKIGAPESDIITDLARQSFDRYSTDRANAGAERPYQGFSDQPVDLRNSGVEHIKSIPRKLDVLGYEIVPEGSCYPDQRIAAFTTSEVECLAVLEHRRWLDEREKAGWRYDKVRDVEAKTSPYLVPWEELPDRAKEWNRSAIRNIPQLLAGENLAITRK